jgi:hypothetical protein
MKKTCPFKLENPSHILCHLHEPFFPVQPALQRKPFTLQKMIVQFLQQVQLGSWFFIGQILLLSSGYL